MNRATVLALVVLCLLSAGSTALADQISYSFSASYPALFIKDNHLGGFALTHTSGVLPASVATTPATIGTNVLAFSLAPKSDPLQLYVPINLTLQDKTSSGKTLRQTVHLGLLFGPVSTHGSDLDFYSFGPKTVTFDQHTYKFTFASDNIHATNLHFAGLSLSQGRLAFTVSDPPSGPSVAAIPEPASFVLAGIGMPLLSLFLRRRRVRRLASSER
jgi:hypothetical protein